MVVIVFIVAEYASCTLQKSTSINTTTTQNHISGYTFIFHGLQYSRKSEILSLLGAHSVHSDFLTEHNLIISEVTPLPIHCIDVSNFSASLFQPVNVLNQIDEAFQCAINLGKSSTPLKRIYLFMSVFDDIFYIEYQLMTLIRVYGTNAVRQLRFVVRNPFAPIYSSVSFNLDSYLPGNPDLCNVVAQVGEKIFGKPFDQPQFISILTQNDIDFLKMDMQLSMTEPDLIPYSSWNVFCAQEDGLDWSKFLSNVKSQTSSKLIYETIRDKCDFPMFRTDCDMFNHNSFRFVDDINPDFFIKYHQFWILFCMIEYPLQVPDFFITSFLISLCSCFKVSLDVSPCS